MSYNIGPITVTPNIGVNNILQNAQAVVNIKLTNGSQFDLKFSGFGSSGGSTCPAGMEYMLSSTEGNDGYLNFLPVDSQGVGGQGVVNMVVYFINDPIPKGSWPVAVPAQRVISTGGGTGVATTLVNTGNAGSSSPIIEIREAGSSGDNVFFDNQGNVSISEYYLSTLTQLLQVVAGVSTGQSNIILGDSSRVVQSNGQIQGLKGASIQGIASGASAVVQAASGTNQPIFEGFINNNGCIGFYANPTNDALTGTIGHYSGGNSATVNTTGFQANGNHLAAFDAEINPGQVVLKWPYGDITAGVLSNTAQRLESSNGTDMLINAPSLHKVSLQINNTEVLSILSSAITAAQTIQSPASTDLFLNVPTSGNAMRLRNAGTDIISIISSAVQFGQPIQPNNPVQASANGSVSGTVSIQCPIWGSAFKTLVVLMSNYQDANTPTLVFPSSMTTCWYYSGNMGSTTWSCYNGASIVTVRHMLTIGTSGAAGTDEPITVIKSLNYGQAGGFDRVKLNGTAGATINSVIFMLGF